MNRNLKALAMLLTLPLFLACIVVFTFALAGIERDAADLYDRAYCYVVGIIMGWWLGGAQA